MPTQEKDQMYDRLLQKLLSREPLDEAEKAHLSTCESCMLHVVKALDTAALIEKHGNGKNAGGSIGDLSQLRPEARRALEHGRRVLEREFGIVPVRK